MDLARHASLLKLLLLVALCCGAAAAVPAGSSLELLAGDDRHYVGHLGSLSLLQMGRDTQLLSVRGSSHAAEVLAEEPRDGSLSRGRVALQPGNRSRFQARRDTQLLLAQGPLQVAEESSEDADSLPFFDLIVIVPSHASLDAEKRTAIRDSWAQYLNESVNCTPCQNWTVKVLHIVGQEGDAEKVEAEATEFNDMGILAEFAQLSYHGLAEKTQRSIRYALEHFKFRLLLKVDTDSWVFMDRLLTLLEQRHLFEGNATLPGIYAGNFKQGTNVRADNWEGNLYSSITGSKVYPVHAKGAGYLLSPDLCEFIAGMGAATEDTSGAPKWGEDYGWAPVPRLFNLPSEDVSVGFWLQAVNHTKVEMPISIHNSACTDDKNHTLVIDHLVEPHQMRQRWQSFLDTGDVCAPEEEEPHSAVFLRKLRKAPHHRLS